LNVAPRLAVDIGGNVGSYTAELRRTIPDLDIHVFEPSYTNVANLTKRFEGDQKIRIVPIALSDQTGTATLYSNVPGSGFASLTKRKLDHFKIELDVKEAVETLRFEEYWLNQLGKAPIDIAKLDVEGHELAVLNGFGCALDQTRVIQFEFGGCNIDTRTFFQDFWYFFAERNFDIHRITPFGLERIGRYRESDEFFSTTNYIAVNRR
jgi:FkbM family methyltransferase